MNSASVDMSHTYLLSVDELFRMFSDCRISERFAVIMTPPISYWLGPKHMDIFFIGNWLIL